MINVAIADDQVLFRKGMVSLINSFYDINVKLEAGSGQELIDHLEDDSIDLVLLDISMPGMNGLETLANLKINYPGIKVIIVSAHDEEKYVIKMIDLGANAYLIKNAEPDEVENAIRTVVSNDFYFNKRTLEAMKNGYKYKKEKIILSSTELLTNREKEILQLLCKEQTTPEIASSLFISERTVEGHRQNLLTKTGCRNTAGLVIFAIKEGLFNIDL